MKYLPGYLLCCWLQVMMSILESVFGDYPYRYDYTDGDDACRPLPYHEYAMFRDAQQRCGA